jgi:hypothetical protein
VIFRYGVECAGCGAKILLRVSVALDDVQPFFFLCEHCGIPTKVKQFIRYEPHPHAWLELEAGCQIDAVGLIPDQVININPELPSKPDAGELTEEGGSPFIMHFEWLGDRLEELMERIRTFREVTNKDWIGFKRLGEFYVNRNWALFDGEGRRLLEEEWPTFHSDVGRHDAFNRLLQTVFMPLVASQQFPDAVAEYAAFMNAHTSNNPALYAYSKEQLDKGVIATLQRDVLRRFDFVVEHRPAFLSALPLEFYPPSKDPEIDQLRLFRDEFDSLKLHYVDSYELAHKALTPVLGFVNCLERGASDSFDPAIMASLEAQGKKTFGDLKSLVQFGRQPNTPKAAFLQSLPILRAMWGEALKPDLRNAMGHHDARHDLRSGMVRIGDTDQVSYIRVAATTCRTVALLLMLAHLLKTFCIVVAILHAD